MDLLALPWTFAPAVKASMLTLALVGQIWLTFFIYDRTGKARMKAGREGRITAETYRVVGEEPADLALMTRTLANQFELPVLFYTVVLAHLALGTGSWLTVVLAWVFVVMRIVHAREMMGENRVMLRRKRFFQSMGAFAFMVVELLLAALVLPWVAT